MSCEDLIRFAFRISSGNSVEAPLDWLPGEIFCFDLHGHLLAVKTEFYLLLLGHNFYGNSL